MKATKQLSNPEAPATPRQTWALFCATKKDWRKAGLTKQQASDMLDELMNKERRAVPMVDAAFPTLYRQACDAASMAAIAWLEGAVPQFNVMSENGEVVGTLLDACGNAWLETDRRTAFAKWASKTQRELVPGTLNIRYVHKERQEWGLHEAAIIAAKRTLEEAGITGLRMRSYID